MPRIARFDAPGAIHHVMLRGVDGRPIFADDSDRADFVDRLERVVPEADASCYAWALVENHVHLLLKTGQQPLATVMARLGTGYAVQFNRKYARAGHLFQNRYKSLLVQDDPYFLVALRYVHLNPFRAGLVASVDALSTHPWTGHAVLMGNRVAGFQQVDEILALFARGRAAARRRLAQWMTGDSDAGAARQDAPPPSDRRVPREQEAPPACRAGEQPCRGLEEIVAAVCRALEVDPADLASRNKRRCVSDARAAICYLASREQNVLGVEVARALKLSEPAVSRARLRGPGVVEHSPALLGLAASQVKK